MADGFSANVRGLKEVDAALASLGSVAGEKVMRSVIFSASKPILDRTKSGLGVIQRGSGALTKATRRVYLKAGASTRGGGGGSGSRFTVAIAPKVKDQTAIALANLHYKRKRSFKGVFWGHLLEWGHRIGTQKSGRLLRSKSVAHTGGRVAGRFVFTRAAEASAPEAISLFEKLIFVRVERALRSAKKIK